MKAFDSLKYELWERKELKIVRHEVYRNLRNSEATISIQHLMSLIYSEIEERVAWKTKIGSR